MGDMRTLALTPLLLLLLAGCQSAGPEVLVTLDDGQKLVGSLTTRTFALETGMGTLAFDSAIAGELGPVEGGTVEQSERMVRLWLRNGSEFVGRWQRPAVEVELDLGEKPRTIQVPIAKLQRLQFRGAAIWADDAVFRVVTRDGDDFFVDVTRTRLAFTSDLGEFDPYLAEIDRLEPLDAKKTQWRITLGTGTVFNGTLRQTQLDLRLAVGPEAVTLPLAAVKQMDKQRLDRGGGSWRGLGRAQELGDEAPFGGEPGGFYSNRLQKASKARAAQQWRQTVEQK